MPTIEQIIVQLKLQMKKSMKKLQGYNKTMKKNGEMTKHAEKQVKKLGKAQGQLGRLTKQTEKKFAGWAMSMMFFGMAIQRVFKSILDAGVSTFQEVMHSVEGTVTPLDMLKASFEKVKYAIGSAISNYLDPFQEKIDEIIDKITEFIESHQDLVASFILGGLAVGTVLMSFGMLKLGIDGIISAFGKLKILGTKLFSAGGVFGEGGLISGAISSLASSLGVSFGAALGIIIGAVIAFIALIKTNFGDVQGFVKDLFNNMISYLESIFKNFKGFFVEIWGFIMDILTGDWDKALEHLIKALAHLVSFVLKTAIQIGTILANAFIFPINLILDTFKTLLKGWLSLIKKVAEVVDSVLGTNLASNVEDVADKVSSFGENLKIDYIGPEDIEPVFEGIDETLGLGEKEEKYDKKPAFKALDETLGLGEEENVTKVTNNYDTGAALVEDIQRQSNANYYNWRNA